MALCLHRGGICRRFADALEFCAGFCACAALAGAVTVVLAVCVAALGCSAFVFTGALAVAVVLPSALAGTAFSPATGLCFALPSFPRLGGCGWPWPVPKPGVFLRVRHPFWYLGFGLPVSQGASFGGWFSMRLWLSLVEGVVCFGRQRLARRFLFCAGSCFAGGADALRRYRPVSGVRLPLRTFVFA